VSRKSERLVNLTIALLATKRYLTKAEIFSTVAGYTGEADAKDRMFERDKDDLRSLGIEIELGTFDPLFEDEAGYRIKPESYALQIQDLDTTSIAILSRAATMWHEAALGEAAQTSLRKLKGLGMESDIDTVLDLSPRLHITPEQLPDLIEAITERREISFEYLDENLKAHLRSVQPYRISNAHGHWYLIGHDNERDAIRTYRVDRMRSSISLSARANSYEVDQTALDLEDQEIAEVPVALIRIRKGKAPHLRAVSAIKEFDLEWDEIEIQYHDASSLIREILWQGPNAYVISPQSIRDEVISRILEGIELHG
jgi:proteasome accessory factor B